MARAQFHFELHAIQYIDKAYNFPQTLIQTLNLQMQRKMNNPNPHNNTSNKPKK